MVSLQTLREIKDSLGNAAQNIIQAGGIHLADESEIILRLDRCHPCPEYNNGKCNLCHCVMAMKVRLKDMNCPIGKWGFVPECKPSLSTINTVPKPFFTKDGFVYAHSFNEGLIWEFKTDQKTMKTTRKSVIKVEV